MRLDLERLSGGEIGTVLGWETITNPTIDDQIKLLERCLK